MSGSSLRDRLLTHQGARALLSPVGLVAGIALAVVAGVAGLPVVAAAVVGIAVWGANAWRLLPHGARPERIDPFTLHDPWRRFVQEALQSRARFAQAVERAPGGPLRDRLREIGERVNAGVEQCWLIARRGEALVVARRGIDTAELDRQIAGLGTESAEPAGGAPDPALARLQESLTAQRAAAVRLDQVIDRAQTELRVLDARLGEAVARTLELSAHAGTDTAGDAVAGLIDNVDGVVGEMESLRQALEETDTAAGGLGTGNGPATGNAGTGDGTGGRLGTGNGTSGDPQTGPGRTGHAAETGDTAARGGRRAGEPPPDGTG